MRAEFIVFLLFLAIFLYVKTGGRIAIPGIGSAVGTLRSILFREQIATTALFALFLLALWYTFGGFWVWWWNSGMFLPSVIAATLVILFANCEWRKTMNNGLMSITGILIAGTLAINALLGWWSGGKSAPQTTTAIEAPEATPVPAPAAQTEPSAQASPPSPSPKLAEIEKKDVIIATYDVFTPVEFPPNERLIKFRWMNAPRGCVVAVISDDMPNGAKFRCNSTVQEIGTIRKIGFASDIPGVTLEIPIQYTYVPNSAT